MSAIHRKILTAIESWDPLGDSEKWRATHFDNLARAVFEHQYTHNEPYRTLCDNRGLHPGMEIPWRSIPAVPTDAFKVAKLFAGQQVVRTFRTSGTTAGDRGSHHFETLEPYRASLHPTFRRFCNPEGSTMRMLVLAPSPRNLKESSLSFMLGELVHRWGDDESAFFVELDEQAHWNLRIQELGSALDRACAQGVKTMILGTAFAYAEFLDELDDQWRLPKDSRLMETGGFKGRERSLSRQELYRTFSDRLGIERSHCLGEYSMTELSSQTYTDTIRSGKPSRGYFHGPPWLGIEVVDPVDLEPIEEYGEVGLIRFFDLANIDSVSAIQTSDRGILHETGGLELIGRAPDAELRGCSLTIEEITGG